MSIIQQLKDEGALVLYHDYRSGHCLDLSGQGNDGVNTGYWSSDGLQFGTTDEVTVADAPELQLTEGTLVVLGDFHVQTANKRVIYKRDGGGTNYDFFTPTAGQVGVYDGTATRTIAVSIIGHKYLAVNIGDGTIGEVFLDGLSIGNLNAVSAISADNAPLIIGNDAGGGNPITSPIKAALIFNRKLTATEHAQLYSELSNLTWPRKSYAKAQGNYGPELVTDGDSETAGVAAWYAGNSATLTKETGNVLGGSQVLRVAHGGANDPFADQAGILTPGTRYRIIGWARGDGTGYPEVSLGDDVVWAGSTAATWQRFDVTARVITNTYVILKTVIGVAGYCEFDNITAREVYNTENQFKTDW